MAKYYTLDEDGNPVEHEGEAHDMPTDYKQKLLEYGWIPPAAVLGAKVVKEGVNLYKSRRSAKEKPSPMAFGDEGIIDVPSKEIPEKQPIPKGWEDIVAKSEANAASKAAEAAAKANTLPTGYTQGVPSAANPMDKLSSQPPAYPLIKPETPTPAAPAGAVAPTAPMQAAQPPAAPVAPPQTAPQATPVAPPAPPASSVAQRTRRNAEQIAADREALLASAPEGRLPSAPNPKKSNKLMPGDVVGQGGWHWYKGQMGPEAEENWLRAFGRTNVSESEVRQAMKEGRLPSAVVQNGRGGSFPREATVPNYIKGGASIAGMAGAAAIPGLAAAGYHAYKGNKEAVDAELKDAWNSMKSLVTMPVDVAKAASKGDFGPFKDLLMSINPGTLLMNEVNKNDEAALQRMIQSEKVGAGRGIAPPSAYR